MSIIVPPGYHLGSEGTVAAGGPAAVIVPSGYSLTSDGRLVYNGPKWDTPERFVAPQECKPKTFDV